MTEKVAEILEKIRQIEYILDNIKAELTAGDFKTPQAAPPKPTEWKLGEGAKAKAQEILDAYPNMTKEKIEQLIGAEQAKAAGLLTEEAAAHLIASNLEMGEKELCQGFPVFEVGKYIPEITGELVDDPIVREVDTRSGPTQVGNVRLTDGSETIRIAMWGGLADALNTYQKGESVTITGLSVKDPYDGVTQLSSTRKTEISSKN